MLIPAAAFHVCTPTKKGSAESNRWHEACGFAQDSPRAASADPSGQFSSAPKGIHDFAKAATLLVWKGKQNSPQFSLEVVFPPRSLCGKIGGPPNGDAPLPDA